jgi:DnaK suppressor protein
MELISTKLRTESRLQGVRTTHRGIIVGDTLAKLDAAFVERKRLLLTKLRDELKRNSDAAQAEEGGINRASQQQPEEYEDDAQRLDLLERAENLVGRDVARIARVQRALEKIAEGTYGFSDVSGKRIPDDRLEVMPDAINTLGEQEASEQTR